MPSLPPNIEGRDGSWAVFKLLLCTWASHERGARRLESARNAKSGRDLSIVGTCFWIVHFFFFPIGSALES